MDFVLAKLLGWLAQPSNLLLFLAVVAALLPLGRSRIGRLFRLLPLLALLAGGLLPLGRLLFHPLETRFAAPDSAPERVAGIVVLGGALAVDVLARWGEPALNDSAERVVAAVGLARRWPEARVLHSGGGTADFGTRPSEADAARLWFAQGGLAPDRLLLEDRSRNTAENAELSKALVDPKPGEVWLLVTSAWHMPRAVGAFRQAGWSVVPWPVDHRSTGRLAWDPARTAAENLRDLDNAVREWLGLAYYRWRGWTDRLVPGPEPVAPSVARADG